MEVEREQRIREIAYRIWQEEGYPHGNEVQHWLKAEALWQEENNRAKPALEPTPEIRTKAATKTRKPQKKTRSRKAPDVQREL
jgi:hypothetical protein